ncbi:MAG TPA: TerC family protein [Thermoanaerobaculaceae bacterium]|nr:TerC family protein [Thermoanaerobaculaceae bacterium]
MTLSTLFPWIAFNVAVIGVLALDLGVFHRTPHAVSLKEATVWSVIWILLALVFNAVVLLWKGQEPALQFLAGYLIEKSLSVDNIFVFVLIFTFFAVPVELQHRVLFWGILGALIMRGVFIAAGAALLEAFHWVMYLFGAFLVATGVKMALMKHAEVHPENNPLVRLVRRLLPVAPDYRGSRFFVREAGRWMATPLLLVLVMVESTDLVFAVDSIPAIFAITRDPFIVYTSNVLAILGLRSLYFLLAGIIQRFRFLKLGLSVVLVFVGVKMVLSDVVKIPIGLSLGIITVVLAVSIVASLRHGPRPASERGSGSAAG